MIRVLRRASPTRRIVAFLAALACLEGGVLAISLLSHPSQAGGFLGFSTGRWGILLAHFSLLAGAGLLLFLACSARLPRLEGFLSSERVRVWLLLASIVVCALSAPAVLGAFKSLREFPYYGRLQPTLAMLALTSGQVGLTLLVVLRRTIARWFAGFFPEYDTREGIAPLPRSAQLAMLFMTAMYLALQLAGSFVVREALWLPDSIDYILPASMAWDDPRLWTWTKPWGAAILYKLTGNSPVVIDAVQSALSTLAWLALALAFSRQLHAVWLRAGAFGLVLGFSLAPQVQIWNHIIQSESLSLSLFALILAAWISLVARWRWWKLLSLVFLLAWWTGTRETNVYLGILVAAILVIIGLFYRRQRFYWGVSALLILFSAVNLQISEVPTLPRWLYPLTNTLLNRILPEEDYFSYFQARGLDPSPELLALSGGLADSSDFAVFNDPDLSYVEEWLFRKGKQTYVRFLLDHPLYTLTAPWQQVYELLAPQDLLHYAPGSYRAPLAWLFGGLLFPGPLWLLLALACAALYSVLRARPWRTSQAFWLFLVCLTLSFPHLYIVWHGDAAEVGRHAIQASVQLRLALWLMLALALDRIGIPARGIRTRHRP